ncbi:RNA-dependent RNA polymerase, partial [Blattodean arli-related virus OKIAV101]
MDISPQTESIDDHESFIDKHPRIPDVHLQSPIRRCVRESLFCPAAENPKYINDIITTCPYKVSELDIDSESTYGIIFHLFFNENIPIMNWIDKQYQEAFRNVVEFVQKTHEGLSLPPITDEMTFQYSDRRRLSELTRWNDIRDNVHQLRMQREVRWLWVVAMPYGFKDIRLCGHFMIFVLEEFPNKHFVFDYEQLMMICDTLSARVMTLWYCNLLSPEMPGWIDPSIIMEIYRHFDDDLIARGNDSYGTICFYESICLAIMLHLYEEFSRAGLYLKWLEKELSSPNHSSGLSLLKYLLGLSLSCPQYSELHGMFRHWGHPTVQESLGCEKVSQIGKTRSYPDIKIQREMAGLMKRQFFASFSSKHGRPPRIKNLQFFLGKPIYLLLTSEGRALNAYSNVYSLSDWGFVQFGKEFEFDYHADYTELIDDKALSPLRSELRTAFCPEKLGYKTGQSTTSRRVLEEILNRETIDVREICNKVSTRMIPEDWKIIMLHAKERELKVAPRLFAMMVLEMRLYFCVTEANIAEFIFKYFPQQTMTLDESDLTKRLLILADIMRDPEKFLGLFNIVDFSSWNVCHTDPMTNIFFAMLDDLFGTPGLFYNTHWFFEQCLICLTSHMSPPTSLINCPEGDPPECNELWYKHCGGFEGLRQKGWTLITISLLLMVEHEVGMKGYIIGQGDNQICKIMIPVPEEYHSVEEYLECGGDDLDHKANLFLQTLTDIALHIGLIVKPEETCSSRNVIIYGKDIIYKGSFMPQAIKRISRTMPEVNEVYPTMETKIATIQTSGSSSSQKSLDYVVPYIVSTTETLCSIMKDIFHRYKRGHIKQEVYNNLISESFKQFVLCSSAETVGCPILSPVSFLYRGHPDPVTSYLTYLHSLRKVIPMADRMYRYIQELRFDIGDADPELLVSNPCSLNIKLPKTIGNLMRQELEKVLNQITVNKDLSMIFNEQSSELDRQFFAYLISSRPC